MSCLPTAVAEGEKKTDGDDAEAGSLPEWMTVGAEAERVAEREAGEREERYKGSEGGARELTSCLLQRALSTVSRFFSSS